MWGWKNVDRLPEGFATLLVPVLWASPFILALIIAAVPWLVVRAARRRRVEQLELELPVTLELMASLGEAGLGFDAAIERLAKDGDDEGVLADEFVTVPTGGHGRTAPRRRPSADWRGAPECRP